jgi:hypothetical protein
MLERIGAVAARLHPWKKTLWLGVLGSALLFAALLFIGEDRWLLPLLALCGGLMAAAVIAQSFYPLPPRPNADMRWLRRVALRLKRFVLGGLALLVRVALAGVLFLGLRALGLLF